MKKLFYYFSTLIALILLVGCKEQQLEIGKIAPDIAVKDAQGKMRKLSEFEDKVILLDFWSKNCGACIYSIPLLNEVQSELSDKVVVISVGTDTEYDQLNQYGKENNVQYMMTSDQLGITQERYQVMGFPTLFFINKKHVLEKVKEGISLEPQWLASVKDWINQQDSY